MSYFGIGILEILLLAMLILGIPIAAIILSRRGRLEKKQTAKTPIDVAKERYAKGEISKTEFDEMWQNLIAQKERRGEESRRNP